MKKNAFEDRKAVIDLNDMLAKRRAWEAEEVGSKPLMDLARIERPPVSRDDEATQIFKLPKDIDLVIFTPEDELAEIETIRFVTNVIIGGLFSIGVLAAVAFYFVE